MKAVIDPQIQDPNLKAKDLEVWEVFRIFYAGVQQALADDTDWPPPAGNSNSAGFVQGVLSQLVTPASLSAIARLVPQAAPIVSAVQGLLSATKPATPAPKPPTGTIPNPSAKPATVSGS